jgi:hypothetical protein
MQNSSTSEMEVLINEDMQLALNIALFNRLRSETDSSYFGICGGFIEGVQQWAQHNIISNFSCQNHKWFGWTIELESGHIVRAICPIGIMKISPKNWDHAKNLLSKYMQIVKTI